MKVLLVGNGGREHALGWGLVQSAQRNQQQDLQLYFAPGNPGTASLGTNISIPVTELQDLVAFAKEERIDLTIVGPELPLSLGIVDEFKAENLLCFGPSKAAAELEASKNFAKEIMNAAGVPTAKHQFFTDADSAVNALADFGPTYIVKADGLAAGKGVTVTDNREEAEAAIRDNFQSDGVGLVLEECLIGREASFIVMTDGERIVPLPTAHDYKRIGDGDTGPNTGGMGTVSPTPHLSEDGYSKVMDTVIRPTLAEMKKRGIPFQGFLYAGLMVAPNGDVNVIEFNARMGDPEAQVLMRRWQGDLLGSFQALCSGDSLPDSQEELSESAVCVTLASAGYPASSRKGDVITGITKADALGGCVVFHAGTGINDAEEIITNGGRVLSVTATGESQDEARLKAYQALEHIQFDGAQHRKDIAANC